MAGSGQTNHSAEGPNRSTNEHPTIPRAMPNRNSTIRNGTRRPPYKINDNPNRVIASTSITNRPNALVMMLDETRPARYSLMEIGEPKTLRKFRDQTSSKNAIVTPNITRVKKSHISTAPSRTGTKSKPAAVTVLRYLVMKPHRMMSIATQMTSDNTRVGPPRRRYIWRRTMAQSGVKRNGQDSSV